MKDFSGIVRLGYLDNDYSNNPNVMDPEEIARRIAIYRVINLAKEYGADVTWRVVFSTPDVKNTNFNYVGSTPYESLETFDIKGLAFNHSSNVQIEVSCEKTGYITQRKRFDLRSVIDSKDISTKFNLVKEE